MEIIALQKTTRQTPRKLRLVANAVRKLPLQEAIRQLGVTERRSSLLILKVLRQAIANAIHNHRLTLEQLKIKNILVTEGPRYKRFQAVSRGRAHGIIKRTSHVKVILESVEKTVPAKAAPAQPKTAKVQPKKKTNTKVKTSTKNKK